MASEPLHLNPRFDWRMPVTVRFGHGAAEAIASALGARRTVLLSFAGALGHPAPASLRAALADRVVDVVEVPDGLSSVAVARQLAARLWPLLAEDPEPVLLAVGGGSVLDLAKLLRCRPVDGDFEALLPALRGEGEWPKLHLAPLWLVPTTAGTGSEVTRWATVWDTEEMAGRKRSFDEPFGFAERAFVDPSFTLSCPPQVVRDSALDALSHALEALWNRHANPISDVLAVAAARRVIDSLPAAQRNPADPGPRAALSLAALQAGLAFAQTRTALAHALSYALTLEAGTPHGLACAVWLPAAWRLAAGRDPCVDARLAEVFGVPARAGANRLVAWLQAVGVDPWPESQGVSDAEGRIAQALASVRGRNFIGANG